MPNLTRQEADRLIEAYRADRPVAEICRRFSINKATLYAVLEGRGEPLRAAGRGRKPAICQECTPEMAAAGMEAMRRYKHLDTAAAAARIWAAMEQARA
jgi:hypothetical protein